MESHNIGYDGSAFWFKATRCFQTSRVVGKNCASDQLALRANVVPNETVDFAYAVWSGAMPLCKQLSGKFEAVTKRFTIVVFKGACAVLAPGGCLGFTDRATKGCRCNVATTQHRFEQKFEMTSALDQSVR